MAEAQEDSPVGSADSSQTTVVKHEFTPIDQPTDRVLPGETPELKQKIEETHKYFPHLCRSLIKMIHELDDIWQKEYGPEYDAEKVIERLIAKQKDQGLETVPEDSAWIADSAQSQADGDHEDGEGEVTQPAPVQHEGPAGVDPHPLPQPDQTAQPAQPAS